MPRGARLLERPETWTRWPAVAATVAVILFLAVRPIAAQTCSIGFTPADHAMGDRPSAVATTDFNRDGYLDVATADRGPGTAPGTVSVRLGGAGGFGAVKTFTMPASPANSAPFSLAVADFNNDGKPDLAVADLNVPNNRVLVLINDGNWATGGFDPPRPRGGLPSGARALAVADFNRNGKPDLAVATNTNLVSILDGQGDGNFSGPVDLGVGGPGALPYGIVAGDFDRDGFADFAALVDDGGQDYVSYRFGDGTAFGSQTQVTISSSSTHSVEHLVLADFNHDGRLDIIVAGNDSTGPSFGVYFLEGNAAGGFDAPGAGDFFSTATNYARALAVGDFNADGAADLAVPNGHASSPETTILRGRGDGTFVLVSTIGADLRPVSAAVGDFNRDGRDDVVVANESPDNVRVHLSQFRTGALACSTASFGPAAPVFATGGLNPLALAKGQFGGPGPYPDLVVANFGTGPGNDTVAVLQGSGSGNFLGPLTTSVGDGPRHVAVADFNRDGNADVAVANSNSDDLTILLGDGGGNFPAQSTPGVGDGPVFVEVVDLDGNGYVDLAVSNNNGASVSILMGDGAGSFNRILPDFDLAGSVPAGLARGDFNHDGHLDLAVADSFQSRCWILLGDGTGGFSTPPGFVDLSPALSPMSVVAGYFDTGGDLDLAIANSASGDVSILLGTGNGGFTVSATIGTGGQPFSLAEGDFDRDGEVDLAAANQVGGTIAILSGNGGGGFVPTSTIQATGNPVAAIAGDFNEDGLLDLATANGQDVVILSGESTGGFAVAPRYGTGASDPRSIAVADFDRDGILDLATPNSFSNTVGILRGLGGGVFDTGVNFPTGTSPQHVAAGDYDRDGDLDLAVANAGSGGTVFILFNNNGSGAFPTSASRGVGPDARFVATADFDQDGDLDLAVAYGTNPSGAVRIFENVSGSFSAFTDLTGLKTPSAIAVGDFNEDGDPDLAVASRDAVPGSVSIFVGNGVPGGMNFNPLPPDLVTDPEPIAIAAADFDGDGDLDLAVANRNTAGATGTVSRFRWDGASFTPLAALPAGKKPTGIVTADFDGDGKSDLAVSNLDDNGLAVHLGDGGFGFSSPRRFGIAANPFSVATGDFDRNGKADLAATDIAFDSVSILLNTNCTRRRMALLVEPSSCDANGSSFLSQPRLRVLDDGGSVLQCDTGTPVSATLLDTPGSLGGNVTVNTLNGNVDYTNLRVDPPAPSPPGGRYRLKFSHPTAGEAWSRSFTQELSVDISGPTELCETQPALFTAGLGYETYEWGLGAPTPLVSVAPAYSMPGQASGSRSVYLTVTRDTCTASLVPPHAVTVRADLSSVALTPNSPVVVTQASTPPGPVISETHNGGGALTYQWGFRTAPGPTAPITDLPGQTGPTYQILGSDFPGIGRYYLVVRVDPACGGPMVSDEVQVDVSGGLQDTVRFFTVTSRKGENRLEWINPPDPPYTDPVTVDIHRSTSATNCSTPGDYPSNPNASPLDTVFGSPGGKSSYTDSGLTDGTTYCYTLFVVKIAGTEYSGGRSNRGRPFDNGAGQAQEQIRWAYSVGTASIVPPGIGVDAIHLAANDNTIHSVTKGDSPPASGTWPANWRPFNMNGPSQGRPTTITAGGLGPPKVIYLGSQDGKVYGIDAETGAPVWSTPLPPGMVQAGPSGIFAGFGSAFGINYNLILVGTRKSSSPNTFYALKADDPGRGSVVWSQDGAGVSEIGIISGQALVDYANQRVYFTSWERDAVNNKTVWCLKVNPLTGNGDVYWAKAYGSLATAPTLRASLNRLYLGTNDGRVLALDTETGDPAWSTPFDTGTGQPIKGYVVADRLTGDLYFSTTNEVWAIKDDVGDAIPKWTVSNPDGHIGLAGASTPIFLPGGSYVYVGSADGSLHRLDSANGAEARGALNTFPLPLGDGSGAVGSPTMDTRQGFVYVGTDAGVVYAVKLIP